MSPNYLFSNIILGIFRGRKKRTLFFIGILVGIIIATHLDKKALKTIKKNTDTFIEWSKEKIEDFIDK